MISLGWLVVSLFTGCEMLACLTLVMPLPLDMKRSFLQWLSNSPLVSNFRSFLWIAFLILAALCTESLWIVYISGQGLEAPGLSHEEEHVLESQYFASQRNACITGFGVFLLVLLSRFSTIVTELFKLEQKAVILQKQAQNQETAYKQLAEEVEKMRNDGDQVRDELREAKGKLKDAKNVDLSAEALKKQAMSQQEAFMRLVTEKTQLEKEVEELRSQLLAKDKKSKKDD